MKVLHISTFDTAGGAAIAAYRLHRGLQNISVDSQMLVRAKFSDDKAVVMPKTDLGKSTARLRANLDSLPLRFYHDVDYHAFSPQWVLDGIASQVAQLTPNVINLHWVCNGYLQIETIPKLKKPLVWTLHDMWPFTGGCHYSEECDRHTNSCGACPQLKSNRDWDLSRFVWQRKVKAWKDLNLTIVGPSHWLAQCARKSFLFQDLRVDVIPHGLDTERYKPINKKVAREIFNLPQDKQLVLFGALSATQDRRKGFDLLQLALQKLGQSQWKEKIELVVFGSSQPESSIDLGFNVHYLSRLKDDTSLALVYSSADVMIVPSVQEAFGQTASESLACGTPVVAFDGTGLSDIVEHQRNGYLVKPFNIEDLAQGVVWVLENNERHQKLCKRAREKAEQEFSLELQAHRYLSLYSEIVARCKHPTSEI